METLAPEPWYPDPRETCQDGSGGVSWPIGPDPREDLIRMHLRYADRVKDPVDRSMADDEREPLQQGPHAPTVVFGPKPSGERRQPQRRRQQKLGVAEQWIREKQSFHRLPLIGRRLSGEPHHGRPRPRQLVGVVAESARLRR